MDQKKNCRPRTTYETRRRVLELAEEITGEEPWGFDEALTIVLDDYGAKNE